MNKLNRIISLLALNEETGAEFVSNDKFILKKKNFFTVEISSDNNENITVMVAFTKKIEKDRLEPICEKLSKINNIRALSGFGITNNNTISKYWWFSALEEDENIAFALSMYLSDLFEFSNY